MDDLVQEPVAWMSPGKERLEFSGKGTVYGSHTLPLYTEDQMCEYAKKAVEAEREACAYVAEQAFRYALDGYEVADRIRARSLD